MAYVNVLEWRCEQVAEWLRGLDDSIYPYAHYFVNNNVSGKQLLNLTVSDLYKLHVEKLGHQEIILDAVERLKHLHHNLDTENLQYICLKLSCRSRSVFNEINLLSVEKHEKQKVDTATMSAVAEVLDVLISVLAWLDRPPFNNSEPYYAFKASFIKIGIELATNTARDTFAEKPVQVILKCCGNLADLSDSLIRDVNDALILQPASLDVATTKRRAEDFGIGLDTTGPTGVHVINEIRFHHQSGQSIQLGDEIVQVNYQTVVGWKAKKMLQLMEENPAELILTLKKRPRHLPVFGQIYMKPFRIPARQNSVANYYNNLPSPRAELLVAPNISFPIKKTKRKSIVSPVEVDKKEATGEDEGDVVVNNEAGVQDDEEEEDQHQDDVELDVDEEEEEEEEDDDEAFLPNSLGSGKSISPTQSVRSLLLRPRSSLVRRATISEGSPSQYRPYINVSEIWTHVLSKVNGSSKEGAKSNEEKGESCSNTSTMHSNDSGLATLYSSNQDCRPSMASPPRGRPATIGPDTFDPSYINVGHKSEDSQYINLSNCSTNSSFSEADRFPAKQPVPKPRTNVQRPPPLPAVNQELASSTPDKSGFKKRPVPQPRSFLPKTTSAAKTKIPFLLPDQNIQPVPTANFKSFRRFPASAPSLEMAATKQDTTAEPALPPKPKTTMAEQSLPPSLPSRGGSTSSVPYYMSDVYQKKDHHKEN